MTDAWLTKTSLAIGAYELNPLATFFGMSVLAKGLIAVGVVLALYWFGKEKLLLWMNLAFFGIVAWNLQALGILNLC